MAGEPWRKATHATPGAMRLLYTNPDANQHHPIMRPDLGDRWPENAVVAVIGPFDGHMGQGELQERLLAVVRQWNAEMAVAEDA